MYLIPASLDLGLFLPKETSTYRLKLSKLKGDVGGEQLPRGSHQHHPQDGEEQNAVVLAGMAQVLLHVVD